MRDLYIVCLFHAEIFTASHEMRPMEQEQHAQMKSFQSELHTQGRARVRARLAASSAKLMTPHRIKYQKTNSGLFDPSSMALQTHPMCVMNIQGT